MSTTRSRFMTAACILFRSAIQQSVFGSQVEKLIVIGVGPDKALGELREGEVE